MTYTRTASGPHTVTLWHPNGEMVEFPVKEWIIEDGVLQFVLSENGQKMTTTLPFHII